MLQGSEVLFPNNCCCWQEMEWIGQDYCALGFITEFRFPMTFRTSLLILPESLPVYCAVLA